MTGLRSNKTSIRSCPSTRLPTVGTWILCNAIVSHKTSQIRSEDGPIRHIVNDSPVGKLGGDGPILYQSNPRSIGKLPTGTPLKEDSTLSGSYKVFDGNCICCCIEVGSNPID